MGQKAEGFDFGLRPIGDYAYAPAGVRNEIK